MPDELDLKLASIPPGLRNPLKKQYLDALLAAQSGKWETVGLKAGKICEIVYSIISGYSSGSYPAKPTKPSNMYAACEALARLDKSRFPRSIRLQIPRLICAVYELRNNRDIGHIGGDVDPNSMDGAFFLRSIKWFIAELIRIFHNVDADEAHAVIESVSSKSMPLIWESGDTIRVLDGGMTAKNKVLLILYHCSTRIEINTLRQNVEYSNPTDFKNKVLKPLHRGKLIEFDSKENKAQILPPGILYLEKNILNQKN